MQSQTLSWSLRPIVSHPILSKLVLQSLIPSKPIAAAAEVAARGIMCMCQSCKAGADGQCWLKRCLYGHRLCVRPVSQSGTQAAGICVTGRQSRRVALLLLFLPAHSVCAEGVWAQPVSSKRSSDWNSVGSPLHDPDI